MAYLTSLVGIGNIIKYDRISDSIDLIYLFIKKFI